MNQKMNLFIAIFGLIIISVVLIIINLRKLRLINKNKKRKNGEYKFLELLFLQYKYNIDQSKLLNKKFIILISIINALIISITFYISSLFNVNYVFQLLIAFVLVFGLIYSIYGIMGSIFIKKGYIYEHKRNRK